MNKTEVLQPMDSSIKFVLIHEKNILSFFELQELIGLCCAEGIAKQLLH